MPAQRNSLRAIQQKMGTKNSQKLQLKLITDSLQSHVESGSPAVFYAPHRHMNQKIEVNSILNFLWHISQYPGNWCHCFCERTFQFRNFFSSSVTNTTCFYTALPTAVARCEVWWLGGPTAPNVRFSSTYRMSRGCVVGLASWLPACGFVVRITLGERDFSLLQNAPDRAWGPHNLLFNGYRGFFPGVKRSECEVNCSPPSSVEVQNEWGPTSTPTTCLHGADRDNCYSDLNV